MFPLPESIREKYFSSLPYPKEIPLEIDTKLWILDQNVEEITQMYDNDSFPPGINKQDVYYLFGLNTFWFEYLHAKYVHNKFWNDYNVYPVDLRSRRFLINWREVFYYFRDYLFFHPDKFPDYLTYFNNIEEQNLDENLEDILQLARNKEEFKSRINQAYKLEGGPISNNHLVETLYENYRPISTDSAVESIRRGKNNFIHSLIVIKYLGTSKNPIDDRVYDLVWETYREGILYLLDLITMRKTGLIDLAVGDNERDVKPLLEFFNQAEKIVST